MRKTQKLNYHTTTASGFESPWRLRKMGGRRWQLLHRRPKSKRSTQIPESANYSNKIQTR